MNKVSEMTDIRYMTGRIKWSKIVKYLFGLGSLTPRFQHKQGNALSILTKELIEDRLK